ncbi:bifunctional purine biosynthesis protein PurH [Actinorhabdospora filicis]|uniref:Bifunctional purine biosynthesis protein PurH n=1 Tax=Actinorhabdospora filicis TaxID=1785913 RepID=A0A9W6SI97_9ACTN|nr:bifunctional phosphoribosylaminoimidazolecarboxamide formyltransferase/IMP cyclohydrolase [Actinorhabdospora filicis]GLZ76470.1 bifunctional purine biosynthesis protein PurH [Actinorhabdospora filicis]
MSDVRKPITRALISVYDKTGLEELARGLHAGGVAIVSTGSTAATIESYGVPVTKVEELTGFPECLDGRVKTLHPRVHAGLLADLRLETHRAQLAELDVEPFDLLISNLYPFQQTIASGASFDECIEQIDIGGPAMVRSSAKNHANVAVVTSPAEYGEVLEAVALGGYTPNERGRLAATAFQHTATYDAAVASWMALQTSDGFPPFVGHALALEKTLRYGENPHQSAALYNDPQAPAGLAQAEQLGGKEMSYNNYVDADAAWRSAHDFDAPCVAIIKHANPCGIAVGADLVEAHRKAHECDPVSAFGGVIATNGEVTLELAEQIRPIFTEVIVAPSYQPEALELLRSKKKDLRILRAPKWTPEPVEFKQISGGVLGQTPDRNNAEGDDPANWKLIAGPAADAATLADLAFAWHAVRSVKSNAILLVKDEATVGAGMGQVNRVDAARLAVSRAGEDRARGSVAASDAFFPFPDGAEVLIEAGVKAIVQPAGSIRDELVIAAAEAAGVTMYATGSRHFYH